jgi:hypothetical protein
VPIPTWSVGQVLTAADVNSWFVPLAAYKAADQSVSSLTLQNDNALVIPLAASAVYEFWLTFTYAGGAQGSSDLKMAWTFPSGTTMVYGRAGIDTTGSFAQSKTIQSDVVTFGTLGSGTGVVQCHGSVASSSTSGSLQLQWAQNSGTVTATSLKLGSTLTAQRVA